MRSIGSMILPLALLMPSTLFSQSAPGYTDLLLPPRAPTAEEGAVLKAHKMVISEQQVRQIFEPYTVMSMPVFITSDSALSGFNGLVQESMRFLELRQHSQLGDILRILQRRIQAQLPQHRQALSASAETDASILRARMTLAVAQHLLGQLSAIPEDIQAAAAEDAQQVTKGSGLYFPNWLGTPMSGFNGIDAANFKPISFYAGEPALEQFFRATTWLQSLPLLINDPVSVNAIRILAAARDGAHGLATSSHAAQGASGHDSDLAQAFADDATIRAVLTTMGRFFGGGRALGLIDVSSYAPLNAAELRALSTQRESGAPLAATTGTPSVRVLPSAELPDHHYFQSIAGGRPVAPDQIGRGLEIAAALGSPTARQELTNLLGADELKRRLALAEAASFTAPLRDPTSLNQDPFAAPPSGTPKPPPPPATPELQPDITHWGDSSTFYQRYLSCLATLLDRQEPDAPALFSSPAWQAKSCQTVLAGWAHMRHSAALHARVESYASASLPEEPGYVEPDPTFFEMLGNLADQWFRAFDELQVFRSDARTAIAAIRADLQALERFDGPGSEDEFLTSLGVEERIQSAPLPEHLRSPEYTPEMMTALEDSVLKAASAEYLSRLRAWRQRVAQWLATQTEETLPAPMVTHYSASRQKLGQRWLGFITLCRQLEALAHKQLRGQRLSDAQREYIRDYGRLLGQLMGYDGSTFLSPRDDAPLCTPILHEPQSGIYRHVGLGRPRLFYILYPTKDGEVLLRGAVNTYEERDTRAPLTDNAWHTLVTQEFTPPAPWLQFVRPPPARPHLPTRSR